MTLACLQKRWSEYAILIAVAAFVCNASSTATLERVAPPNAYVDATAHPLDAVMITGGSGNIGSALFDALCNLKIKPVLVDVRQPRFTSTSCSDFAFYPVDITDAAAVQKIAESERVSGIIHLAAVSRVQWCLDATDDCILVNVNGTANVMEAANVVASVNWLLFASSREVFGASSTFPVDDFTPRAPLNIYGTTKSDAESVLEARSRKPTIVLRLSNVYGGLNDHKERLIPSLLSRSLLNQDIYVAGGDQVMDFSHISDVAAAFVAAMKRLHQATRGPVTTVASRRARHSAVARALSTSNASSYRLYEAFNIVSGVGTRVSDLVALVREVASSSSPITDLPYDARFPGHYEADPARAAKVLGFEANVKNVRAGLEMFRIALFRHWAVSTEQIILDECGSTSITSSLQKSRCAGLRQSLRHLNHKQQSTTEPSKALPQLPGSSRQTVTTRSSSSVPNRLTLGEPHCLIDCSLPQKCVDTGGCTCPSTDVACTDIGEHAQKLLLYTGGRRSAHESSPHKILATLSPSSVLQEFAVALWKATSSVASNMTVQIACGRSIFGCTTTDTLDADDARRSTPVLLQELLSMAHHSATKSLVAAKQMHDAVTFLTPGSTSSSPTADIVILPQPACSHKVKDCETSLADSIEQARSWSTNATLVIVGTTHGTCVPASSLLSGGMATQPGRPSCAGMDASTADLTVAAPFARGDVWAASVNGAFSMPCARLANTLVVVDRSKHTQSLHEAFKDVLAVPSILNRTHLASHATPSFMAENTRENGASTILRPRCVLLKRVSAGLQKHGLPVVSHGNQQRYVTTLSTSQFCVVARNGFNWTTMLAECFYAGCVPVIVADNVMLPYETLLDYRKFSIRVRERDAHRVVQLLRSIPNAVKADLQAHVLRVRNVFVYDSAQDGDHRLDINDGLNPLRLFMMDIMRVRRTRFGSQ